MTVEMLDDVKENNYSYVIRELFVGIREINRRIDELQWVLNNRLCNRKGKKEIIKKINRLFSTRSAFFHSLKEMEDKTNIKYRVTFEQIENL